MVLPVGIFLVLHDHHEIITAHHAKVTERILRLNGKGAYVTG
jgi:hypothetical protein